MWGKEITSAFSFFCCTLVYIFVNRFGSLLVLHFCTFICIFYTYCTIFICYSCTIHVHYSCSMYIIHSYLCSTYIIYSFNTPPFLLYEAQITLKLPFYEWMQFVETEKDKKIKNHKFSSCKVKLNPGVLGSKEQGWEISNHPHLGPGQQSYYCDCKWALTETYCQNEVIPKYLY